MTSWQHRSLLYFDSCLSRVVSKNILKNAILLRFFLLLPYLCCETHAQEAPLPPSLQPGICQAIPSDLFQNSGVINKTVICPMPPKYPSSPQYKALQQASCVPLKSSYQMLTLFMSMTAGMIAFSVILSSDPIPKIIVVSAILFSPVGIVTLIPAGAALVIAVTAHKHGFLQPVASVLLIPAKVTLQLGRSFFWTNVEGAKLAIGAILWFFSCGIINVFDPDELHLIN